MKLGALLLVLALGCGGGADAPLSDVDAGSGGYPAGGSTGTGGAAGVGVDASASSTGGSGGAGGAPAPSCAIPESSLTLTAPPTMLAWEGKCNIVNTQTFYASIVNGQITAGVPYLNQWVVKGYGSAVSTTPGQCQATLEFICPDCAGTGCSPFLEFFLTLPAQ